MQPLAGRIALVTGANTGIGRAAAIELARRGARLFLACRSEARTRPVIEEIEALHPGSRAAWLPLDLGDFQSVHACARRFLEHDTPLHLLINNAGLAGVRELTPSGFEPAFGVNHMGHFLLTRLLTERLVQSAPARVVTVASRAHARVSRIDWTALRKPPTSPLCAIEYCASKLANVLFSAELARRLAGSGVSTYALHPGVVASDFWRRFPAWTQPLLRSFMISNEAGARTILHCACNAPANETGLYYAGCRAVAPSRAGRDLQLAEELWRRSEAWTDNGRQVQKNGPTLSTHRRGGMMSAIDPRIIGTWRMTGTAGRDDAGNMLAPPFGPKARGLVVFQPDGRMMSVLCDGRDSLPAGEVRQFMSYAGNYAFDGSTLTTRVDAASDPSRVGGEQVRHVRFESGKMVLAPPRRLWAGVMQHQELTWERISD